MAVRYSGEMGTLEDLANSIAAASAEAEGLGLYGSVLALAIAADIETHGESFENPKDYRRRQEY